VITHVLDLMGQGMGMKRIGKIAGVAQSAIGNVVYGRGGSNARAAKKLRRATAEALLAVSLDVADGAKVDRAEYDELLAELLARGWTQTAIASHLAGQPTAALQVGRYGGTVFAGNVRKLRQLLCEPVPPRWHAPTRRWVTPTGVTAHVWQNITPSTPGVPPEPWQYPWLVHQTITAYYLDRLQLLEEDRRRLAHAYQMSIHRHGRVA
jgi:hypothetical protein